jgi:hypothetical protein
MTLTAHRTAATALRLAAALILMAALTLATAGPAQASDGGCVTVHLDHLDTGQPFVVSVDNPNPELVTSTNGSFVWFTWSTSAEWVDSGGAETLSFDVSDPTVASATGCPDGSVTIDHDELETITPTPTDDAGDEVPAEIDEALTVERLTPLCEIHPDTLAAYCTLPNLILVIS